MSHHQRYAIAVVFGASVIIIGQDAVPFWLSLPICFIGGFFIGYAFPVENLIAEVDRLRETHRVTLSSLAEAKEALDKVASGAVTLGQCPHAWGACRLGCLSPYICRSFVEEAPDAADLRVKSAALTAELRAAGSAIEKADAFEAALDEEIEKALGNRDMYAVDEQRDALLDSVRARLGLDPLHKESDRD